MTNHQPHGARPRIYLCGPMTGLADFNRAAFIEADVALRARGYDVFNPATDNGVPRNAPWESHMRADIAQLMTCDAMAVLPGTQFSRGSRIEIDLALALGIRPVAGIDEWLGAR